MPYPIVGEHRMPYDIDGTEVGFGRVNGTSIPVLFGQGLNSWLNTQEKVNLNSEYRPQGWSLGTAMTGFWFFFPELREITKIGFLFSDNGTFNNISIEGSNNSTNGMDGQWEAAVFSISEINNNADFWRSNILSVSFSSPMKVIRIGMRISLATLAGLHVYGKKAAGQTPNDIGFTDINGDDLTELLDWGDKPEGTTQVKAIKIKNLSTSKIANAVNLQLNHNNFTMSFGESGPWQSVLDIASIGPQSLSSTIYIKCEIPPPLVLLGPVAARLITAVGSWT